jgi:ribosome-associated translation inhibitor RaiA
VRLDIKTTSQTSRDVQVYAERRLRSTLEAFDGQLDSVTLSLSRTGLSDGASMECRIKMQICRSGIWLIHEARDADPYAAVDRGVDGITRSFTRWLARESNGPLAA